MKKCSEIGIPLKVDPRVTLCIRSGNNGLIQMDPSEALARGESFCQLMEGHFYDYDFAIENRECRLFQLRDSGYRIVKPALRRGSGHGQLVPNIYVGSLALTVYNIDTKEDVETLFVEVLPTKLDDRYCLQLDEGYRENYERMLEDIAERCTELLLQVDAPVYQNFDSDFNRDASTLYQRFAFLKALLDRTEFEEALEKILHSPTTRWKTEDAMDNVLRLKRIRPSTIRQLVSGSQRVKLAEPIGKLDSVPLRIQSPRKVETVDTPENRFIKHVLENFLQFVQGCETKFKESKYEKSRLEAKSLAERLEGFLQRSFFQDISRPQTLQLNSPALQRKSGYRELLSAWLKFDLALKLVWRGGDDVYRAGKRDIAKLYEYWLFFVLYDLMQEKFGLMRIHSDPEGDGQLRSYDHLIEATKDGLQLILKSGQYTMLEGRYESDGWKFKVRFNYNKTFRSRTPYSQGNEGSWTLGLRPDYTLSIWPADLSPEEAELQEQMVHIHFDAKYKVKHFQIPDYLEDEDETLETEEQVEAKEKPEKERGKSIYKNTDLLKMHAYRDAIRRTGGAYVLYPGTERMEPLRGFHEIIPGLGAFAIRPDAGKGNTDRVSGLSELSKFIDQVLEHFKDAASQRRRQAAKTYDHHKDGKGEPLNEPMPHYELPAETYVLVGYCRDARNIEGFYREKRLFNFRMEDEHGSLELDPLTVQAKFLLVRQGKNDPTYLFRIRGNGPKVYSGTKLRALGYQSEALKDNYLVFEIDENDLPQYSAYPFKFWELKGYRELQAKGRSAAGAPFVATLEELLKTVDR